MVIGSSNFLHIVLCTAHQEYKLVRPEQAYEPDFPPYCLPAYGVPIGVPRTRAFYRTEDIEQNLVEVGFVCAFCDEANWGADWEKFNETWPW
jgi:hypothetical protein